MQADKSTFALFFGNRRFFPSTLIADARQEIRPFPFTYGSMMTFLGTNRKTHA